jgi:hypothetical protein
MPDRKLTITLHGIAPGRRQMARPGANGVARRPVPGPLAPERCVSFEPDVVPDSVWLVGHDLQGKVCIRMQLPRRDVSAWWIKVVRHWLAWYHGATEIRIVG